MTKQERYQARKHFDALAEFDAKEQRYCYRIWRYDTEAGKAVPTELTFEKEDIKIWCMNNEQRAKASLKGEAEIEPNGRGYVVE